MFGRARNSKFGIADGKRVVKNQRTPNKGPHSRKFGGFHHQIAMTSILEYSVLRRGACLLSYFLH